MIEQQVYAHFIGIGGAGMSGIARVLHERGVAVTGSDLKPSRYATALAEAGIAVSIGHDARNLGEPQVVVVSSAIPESNPELAEARRRGIDVWPRARMLAHLAEDRMTVAVAGTHGKTTTSSMVSTLLHGAGLDPTFLIGGELAGFGTNARCGAGRHYVVEADESDGSFVYLKPDVALITNIEADHLDHYVTMEAVEAVFCEFIERVPEDGIVVACGDDERLMHIVRDSSRKVVTYGVSEHCDVRLVHTEVHPPGTAVRVDFSDGTSVDVNLRVPGAHNALNATGALAVAHVLGADLATAARALSEYSGVRRRFDDVGCVGSIRIVDDYAHHPTEIRATLAAAKSVHPGRVWALFQPHRYSRTSALGEEFGEAFEGADRVIITDVYSAGETPIPGVTGKTIVDSILRRHPRAQVAYLPHRAELEPYLAPRLSEGDLLLTLGAGDVTTYGPAIVRALSDESGSHACR